MYAAGNLLHLYYVTVYDSSYKRHGKASGAFLEDT
jgi:hypothetical protein